MPVDGNSAHFGEVVSQMFAIFGEVIRKTNEEYVAFLLL